MDGAMPPSDLETPAGEIRGSFDDFFHEHAERLEKLAWFLGVISADDAKEAASHALAAIYRQWDKIANPVSYANRVVTNWVIKRRVQQRRDVPLDDTDLSTLGADDPQLTDWETNQWIQQLLAGLTAKQREIVEARLFGGYTYEEIERRTGCSSDALRQRMRAAIRAMRELLLVEERLAGHRISEGNPLVREEAR